jgi:hypothetical protein
MSPNNETGDLSSNFICNSRFVSQLIELHKLQSFLSEEKVQIDEKQGQSIDLGKLNNLRDGTHNKTSRLPTDEEWELLGQKQSVLASHLNDDLRHKFRIRKLIRYFYTIPIWFLLASIIAIVYYFLYPSFVSYPSVSSMASFLGSLYRLDCVSRWLGSVYVSSDQGGHEELQEC